MYIQDFIEDIRLSENKTHLFKDESECNMSARFAFPSIMFFNTRIYMYVDKSECNMSARFTFPLIMFFNTSSIHMDESECNMSARFAFRYLIIFLVWTIPIYIYIHVPCTQVSDYIYWVLTTLVQTLLLLPVLLLLLCCCYPCCKLLPPGLLPHQTPSFRQELFFAWKTNALLSEII